MLRRSNFFLSKAPPAFKYVPIMAGHGDPRNRGYNMRLITKDGVESITLGKDAGPLAGQKILRVDRSALYKLSEEAFHDVAHLLRPGHLQQLRNIIDDPEASDNDRYVALTLLKNANVAAGRILPGCQDTGTAIVAGYRGMNVMTHDGNNTDFSCDEAALSKGVYKTYTETNLRYSQMYPQTMFDEKNTGTNLPAQIDIMATNSNAYDFMFVAKGGGSANKTFLFQETKAILNPKSFRKFLQEKLPLLGTAACPPYHLAVVVGGTSAEANLKTVKYASCRYLDHLPTNGQEAEGQCYAIRDTFMEKEVLEVARETEIGAQFGGKYFAHDVRVIRLPRHGASCPVGIGVSCSADRQILGRVDEDGVWLEQLETNPAKYLPDVSDEDLLKTPAVKVDLNQPMDKLRQTLSQYPIKTRLSLTGTLVVARDIAHAKLRERLENGQDLPDYFKNHAVYYAGPAKTPAGYASGSFGPTTAGRMDAFVDLFQKRGGSMVMLAKGNRSKSVVDACKDNGGFYLGSIGGPAAILAAESIKKVEVLDMEELGMEAVWKIEVENFPAFIVMDDKGNDFFAQKKTHDEEVLTLSNRK